MKIYKNKHTNLRSNRKLYESIMREVRPTIYKALNEMDEEDLKDVEECGDLTEEELNELFGFGSDSVKKPEAALSLENSDEENAELFIQWCGYFMSKAGNNVSKGLTMLFEKFGEVLVKMPKLIVKGVLMLMSATIKGVTFGVATVGAIILGSILTLVRLTKSGVEAARDALVSLYKQIATGISTFYKAFTAKTEKMATESKETLQRWCGVMSGAVMALANKVDGAVEHLSDVLAKILEDAKNGAKAAVLAVKTWLSCKSQEVLGWISNTAGDIKSKVAKAWNELDKKVRKAYNNAVSALESWMTSIKEAIAVATEKIKEKAAKAKDFVIDKKNKALVYGIAKGVKGLKNQFSEDEVVALVRKAYNENLKPMYNGNYLINEKYFYKPKYRDMRVRLV